MNYIFNGGYYEEKNINNSFGRTYGGKFGGMWKGK